MARLIILFLALTLSVNVLSAQSELNIFDLMERRDLTLTAIDDIARAYFKKYDYAPSTGIKHYERWYYEQQFHLNDAGFMIPAEREFEIYQQNRLKNAAFAQTSTTWTELGPSAKTPTSSWNPGVGRITAVAIHPSDESIIYVSSPGGGIWKSTDAGATWLPLIDFVNSGWMSIYHMYITPTDQNVVYAGLSGGGVLKSTNAGSTWATTGTGPSTIRKIMVHPTDGNIVFACASNGFWRSTNAGSSWTQTQSTGKWDMEFKISDPNIIVSTGSTSSVWRSTDNGVTWTAQTLPGSGRALVSVAASNADRIYIVQASGSEFGRFYKSDDVGVTYATTITGGSTVNNFFGYPTTGAEAGGQATYDMAMAVNPANADEVMIAGIICWATTNAGTSFTAKTQWSYPTGTFGYNHADVHGLEWLPSGNLYSNSDGGVYKTTNKGSAWTDLTTGMGIRQFYKIAVAKTTAGKVSGGAQDNGSSFRQADGTWRDWLGADGMDGSINPTNSNTAIGTSQNGNIYRTTNSGASRSNLTRPIAGNWVTPIMYHPTDGNIIFGGWAGVYRSADAGSTWASISSAAFTGLVNCLFVAPSNANYLYASIGSTLYRTIDGGAIWSNTGIGATVTSICVSPLDPQKVWITTSASSNQVRVSTDGGASFTAITTGLPAIGATSVSVDDNAAENLYVGMNIGVYHRNILATTWMEHATGLPFVGVREVEVSKIAGKLYVATYGRGLWESPLNSTVVPVELISFEGREHTDHNVLSWAAITPTDFAQFVLERSADGFKNWESLGAVKTKNGNGQIANYTFEDKNPFDLGYYRLNMVDIDGASSVSKVISLNRKTKKWSQIKVSPNPASSVVTVDFTSNSEKNFTLQLMDVAGRVVKTQVWQKGVTNQINIADLPNGSYYLAVTDGEMVVMQRVIKF